ncbi:MAG: EAL domain-containing protein [Clostridia bacterium]
MIKDPPRPSKKCRETMLVVDDIAINRAVLKSLFEDFDVLEAVNGQDALITLKAFKSRIAVVLLDIVMPVMDGLDVLREMQRDRELSGIPVIITSGADEMEHGLKAISLGAMDYVTKPIEPALVKLRVASALQKRENERLRVQNQYLLVQREDELRHQKELRHLAEHDALTGLYNRGAFYRQVQQMLLERPDTRYLLIAFDVERFKMINELFGFHEGDRLLCYIAAHIRDVARPGEAFCRLDGDNFALCLVDHPTRMAEILTLIEREMKAYPLGFHVKIILGCYEIPDRSLSVEAMLDRALMAKRSIKGKYKKQLAYYDDELRQDLLHEQQVLSQMESALAGDQFKMYLQAQYNYATGELIGAEALVRWAHPENGLIPPSDFIPIFERNGFIQRLDAYMWDQACQTIRRWLDTGRRAVPLYVSVNLSRMDIYNEMLCDILCGLVQKYQIAPRQLKLEITESAYVQNPQQLVSVVERLRAHGFIVEIDDFGSGYSSLNTLKDLHVDTLKLDMKFLDDARRSKRSDSILYHVISMAKSLGLSVIAEGVETKAQADFLLSVGCALMQGYYFSRPLPIAQFEQLLKAPEQAWKEGE